MDGDPFPALLNRMQAALLAEAAAMGRVPVIVAALNLAVLENFWRHKPGLSVSFTAFGRSAQAVVQRGPGGTALWMDPAADNYRSTWERYARECWGFAHSLRNSGHDVDHVYNRARAQQYGYRLVRMFLVRAPVNRAHGSGYERPLGAAESRRHVKIMKLLDGMSELKVLGLPPVTDGLLCPAHHAAARSAATHYGITIDQALQTLRDLSARAAGGT